MSASKKSTETDFKPRKDFKERRKMQQNNSNVFIDAFDRISVLWKTNKKKLFHQAIVSFFIAFAIVIAIIWWLQDPLFRGKTIYLSKVVRAYTSLGFLFHLGIWALIMWILIKFQLMSKKDYHTDKERNINIADNSPDRLLQTEDDLAPYYDIGTINEVKNNLFGCIDGKYKGTSSLEIEAGKTLVGMHYEMMDENMNLICFGISGSGKSRKKAVLDAFQIIERGESFVCTDTKGALVKILYNTCKEHGYNVKIINHKPDELIYSDGVDIFSLIGDYEKIKKIKDTYEREQAINVAHSLCDDIAQCILRNLSDEVTSRHADFWQKEGESYICFWVNYVFFNEAIPKEEKNFGTIHKYLENYKVRHSSDKGERPDDGTFIGYVDDLATEIKANPILNKTCSYYFSTFLAGTDTIKDSVHGGLKIDLKVFTDELLCKITSKDEIDLSLPAKEKCAYFFVIDTISKKNTFITATMFTLLYKRLYSYIEKKDELKADVPVWIIYDEFLNIGVVPDIVSYMQTAREYLIRHEMFVQTLSDFSKRYDEKDMESILSNCAYWMLIKTEEDSLLERWSKKSGVMNEVQLQERKNVNRLNFLKDLQADITESTTKVERAVLLESEIRKLKGYEMLVVKSGVDVAKVHTWDYTNHPLAKNIVKYKTTDHLPLWKMDEIMEIQQREQRAKQLWEKKTAT